MMFAELDQVPAVAPRIGPYDDTAIALGAGALLHAGARGLKSRIVGLKVFSLQEEPNPPSSLLPNCPALPFPFRTSQEDLCLPASGSYPDPPFAVAQISVFATLEADRPEECQGLIVIRDQKGDVRNPLRHALNDLARLAISKVRFVPCGAHLTVAGSTHTVEVCPRADCNL